MKYLKDKECDLGQEDQLGTKPYVSALETIIDNCDTPFTVGLYGKYGSGKSSIITSLQNLLNNNPKSKYKVFVYNAWKYSEDSFRRTFILDFKKFFKLDGTEELTKFYTDKVEDTSHTINLKKTFFPNLIWLISFIVFVAVVLGLILNFTTSNRALNIVSLVGFTITVILWFIKDSVIVYKTSISQSKYFSPEQFEEIFKEALSAVCTPRLFNGKWFRQALGFEQKLEKIVIVVDNIDRCHNELAHELLLSIKNFLEQDRCVFIIPTDDIAIKRHLKSAINGISDKDSEEFLRKFFNMVVRIKDFGSRDLFNLANVLSQRNGFNFDGEIIGMVTSRFADNPRRVIQFLNNLQAQIVVAQQQDALAGNNGVISTNKRFLARMLIIKEEWPAVYALLAKEPNLILQIDNSFHTAWNRDKDGKYFNIFNGVSLTLNEQEYQFLSLTQNIVCPHSHPEVFFFTKDAYHGLPHNLVDLIHAGNWGEIEKQLEEQSVDFEELLTVIFEEAKKAYERQQYETVFFHVVRLIFNIYSQPDSGDDDSDFASDYHKLKPILNVPQINFIILKFEPEQLIYIAYLLYLKKETYLIDKIINAINILSPQEIPSKEKCLKSLIKYFHKEGAVLARIKDKFSTYLNASVGEFDKYSELINTKLIASSLFNGNFITHQIGLIESQTHTQQTLSSLKTLRHLFSLDVLSASEVEVYLHKVSQYSINDDYTSMSFWFNTMIGFINKGNDSLSKELSEALNNRHQFFMRFFYAKRLRPEGSEDCVVLFVEICYEAYLKTKDSLVSNFLAEYFIKLDAPLVWAKVTEKYKEFVLNDSTKEWPFAELMISNTASISSFDSKAKVVEVFILMLERTREPGKDGLNLDQIKRIAGILVDCLLQSQNPEEENQVSAWFNLVFKIESVKNPVEEELKSRALSMTESQKKKLITLLTLINSDEFVSGVIKSIMTEQDIQNLRAVANKIQNQSTVIKGLLDKLNNTVLTNANQGFYINLINITAHLEGVWKLLSEQDKELIVDKIVPLLTGEQELKIAGLTSIKELKSIPSSQKPMLAGLIKPIDKSLENTEKTEVTESLQGLINDVKELLK